MTDLNLPLLRKTVDWATAEAARVDGLSEYAQQHYFTRLECGTAYCIAGKIAMDLRPDAQIDATDFLVTTDTHGTEHRESPCIIAEEALGLHGVEHQLFRASLTIDQVRAEANRLAETYAGERL